MVDSDISLIRFHRVLRALVHHQPHVVPAQSRDIAFESRARLSATFYFFSAILLVRAHRRVMSSWSTDERGRTIRHYESVVFRLLAFFDRLLVSFSRVVDLACLALCIVCRSAELPPTWFGCCL